VHYNTASWLPGARNYSRYETKKKISLPASDLVASCLERLGSVRREPAHTVLFERGDPVQGVYLVISGKVELSLGTT
jgi:CRP-like cAMP-binding protein